MVFNWYVLSNINIIFMRLFATNSSSMLLSQCASKIIANGEADGTTRALKELATERILATEVDQCTIDSIKQVVRDYLSVA
jgi:hypothetical protein